ncbi:unnamed protein product [Arabidopsis halleri]
MLKKKKKKNMLMAVVNKGGRFRCQYLRVFVSLCLFH